MGRIFIVGDSQEAIDNYGDGLLLKHSHLALRDLKTVFEDQEGEAFSKEAILEFLDDTMERVAREIEDNECYQVEVSLHIAEEAPEDGEPTQED